MIRLGTVMVLLDNGMAPLKPWDGIPAPVIVIPAPDFVIPVPDVGMPVPGIFHPVPGGTIPLPGLGIPVAGIGVTAPGEGVGVGVGVGAAAAAPVCFPGVFPHAGVDSAPDQPGGRRRKGRGRYFTQVKRTAALLCAPGAGCVTLLRRR